MATSVPRREEANQDHYFFHRQGVLSCLLGAVNVPSLDLGGSYSVIVTLRSFIWVDIPNWDMFIPFCFL